MEINTNTTQSNTIVATTSNKEDKQVEKTFAQYLEPKVEESERYSNEKIEEILADIWSLMVNGYTVTELEALQKAISEITNLIREEANVGEIEKLIDKLEKMLREFQQSSSGSTIQEASEDLISSSKDTVPTMEELIFRLEDIKESLAEAIKGKKANITVEEKQEKIAQLYSLNISKSSSSDTLELMEQLKQT